MTVFRLAVALVCFWNLSLGYCLVGRSGTSATRRGRINGFSSRGVLLAKSKSPMRAPSTTATAAAATESTTPTAGGDRVALVFPSSKERFRNLTRAIEYSVAHDEDGDDVQEHESVDETQLHNRSKSLKRLREMNHHVMAYNEHFTERNKKRRIRTTTDIDPRPASAAPFATVVASETMGSKANVSRHEPLSSWLLLVTRLARAFLRSFSLWCWIVGKMTLGKVRKLFTIGRRKEGFSESDLGGTKRHYALLVASLVNGARGLTTATSSNKNGGCCDPLAYHHTIVQSVHHRTVASLSPSALLFSEKDAGGIHVSALQRHTLKWALRNDNNKRKRKRKLQHRDEHS